MFEINYLTIYGRPTYPTLARHRNAIRKLLSRRKHRCHRLCKGWDIFHVVGSLRYEDGPCIQRCDYCCERMKLDDDDVALLQEAQAALIKEKSYAAES